MFIVWYGNKFHDFLVQTDNVDAVCNEAVKNGYIIKDVVRNN